MNDKEMRQQAEEIAAKYFPDCNAFVQEPHPQGVGFPRHTTYEI